MLSTPTPQREINFNDFKLLKTFKVYFSVPATIACASENLFTISFSVYLEPLQAIFTTNFLFEKYFLIFFFSILKLEVKIYIFFFH